MARIGLTFLFLLIVGCAAETETPPNASHSSASLGAARHGMNLSSFRDWRQGYLRDLASTLRMFGTEGSPAVPMDSMGYPTQDSSTLSFAVGYLDGRYVVTFDGSGSLEFSGFAAQLDDCSDRRCIIVLNHSRDGLMTVRFRGIDPARPMRNLHIFAEGDDGSSAFLPSALATMAPYRVLRFMGWMETNDSPVREWSDRTLPESLFQTGPNGCAYEHIVRLLNETGKDGWINIPFGASPAYVRQLARFFATRLNPGLQVYVEYGNELWNGGFTVQYAEIRRRALANPSLLHDDEWGRMGEQVAFSSAAYGDIFREEFAAAGRVRPIVVLGGFTLTDWFSRSGLDWLKARYGSASGKVDAVAIAPYLYLSEATDNIANLTMAQLFAGLQTVLTNEVEPGIRQNVQLAKDFGIRLLAYEGGQHLTPRTGHASNAELKRLAQHDARLGNMYDQLLSSFRRESDAQSVFVHFADFGPCDQWGCWGVYGESVHQFDRDTCDKNIPQLQGTETYSSVSNKCPKLGALLRAVRADGAVVPTPTAIPPTSTPLATPTPTVAPPTPTPTPVVPPSVEGQPLASLPITVWSSRRPTVVGNTLRTGNYTDMLWDVPAGATRLRGTVGFDPAAAALAATLAIDPSRLRVTIFDQADRTLFSSGDLRASAPVHTASADISLANVTRIRIVVNGINPAAETLGLTVSGKYDYGLVDAILRLEPAR